MKRSRQVSFSVAKNKSFRLAFSIGQSEKAVILAIKVFLLNLPGHYRLLKVLSNPVQFVLQSKAKNVNSNPMVTVSVYLTSYISNVLLPLFDNLIWQSKKKQDYLDWKTVLTLKSKGLHFTQEGIEVIKLICNRMNNNRLSTLIKMIVY